MTHKLIKTLFKGLFCTLPLIMIGCSDLGKSPVAPNLDTNPQVETRVSLNGTAAEAPASILAPQFTYFNFSPAQPNVASKKGKNENPNFAAKKISKKKGGKIVVKPAEIPDSDVQLLSATLYVRKKSIPENTEISMTVTATENLEGLVIDFAPSGLQFKPKAMLELVIEGKLDKEAERALRTMYHKHGGSNQVTLLKTDVKKKKRTYRVRVKVPGFSQFYWDDDTNSSDHEYDEDYWDEID